MNFQPITILLTLLGGLALAGILGWIRKPRLVVFVPRLFSHSRISDKGQIVEVSILNRGFKTEEQVELSLNPQLHYELIGSNNPDATLNGAKLAIPRIGSADDCSVLLQADNGKFSHEDIVKCLSKESKGTVTTKLEELPITAQQRVGVVGFVAFLVVAGALLFKSIDKIFETINPEVAAKNETQARPVPPKPDLQGWSIPSVYEDEAMYKQIVTKDLQIAMGTVTRRGRTLSIPITVANGTTEPFALTAWTSSPVDDSGISFERRRVNSRLLFPKGNFEYTLQAATGSGEAEKAALVEVFLTREGGQTLKATRMVSAE
ncbi:hypothetical protein ABB26_11235 [Stenotrophomonas humi]|uniref:Transmembrane protein n=1 Tax=Stenotrophomonas humi TaxID=405444 RepID=A0A0R0CB65_9GAMM|nr:hypothetical protein [Stenotrophomonas humi]KRG63770.1 hypothetical protein ABB26_11235 [Stenotrophomonas humi]